MSAVLLISLLLVALGLANLLLRKLRPLNEDALITRIDQLLPQTQCAQCGFPGCQPYAEAVAAGHAGTHLCAPGGVEVMQALNLIVGEEAATPISSAPQVTHQARAVIREPECIGCTLCLPACPVDAIVGARGYMHTVVTEQCTGCELCVDPCPVDCIEMVPVAEAQTFPPQAPTSIKQAQPCIRCGACTDVCPVSLPAQNLFELVQLEQWPAAKKFDLERCIECGLCDEACPSEIPLQHFFAFGKAELAKRDHAQRQQLRLKQRFQAHQQRLANAEQAQIDKRTARLGRQRQW